eukprot:48077_1
MMSGAFLFSSVTIIRIKIYDSFIESSIVSIVLKSHHNPLRYWSNIVLFHQHSFLCQSCSSLHLNVIVCVCLSHVSASNVMCASLTQRVPISPGLVSFPT